MARRSKTGERVFTVGFMAAVTFVCIASVSAIHLASARTVERNAALFLKQGIMKAAGRDLPDDHEGVLTWYADHVSETTNAAGQVTYVVRENGAVAGYVFPRAGVGLWGPIEGVVGMTSDLAAFTGVAFTDQNETPGLGARITEPWYADQVAGKRGNLDLVPEPSNLKNRDTWSSQPDELHAITGATITSRGVRDMLNTLANEAPNLVKGE